MLDNLLRFRPTRDEPRKQKQIKKYAKEYSACVRDNIKRVERAPKKRMPKILRGFNEAAETKYRTGSEKSGADGLVLKQTHQQE